MLRIAVARLLHAVADRIAPKPQNISITCTCQYGAISKAIADVANRELGGALGLGFHPPRY